MTKPNNMDEMARRYLDLWEENLALMADDHEVAEIMARTIELMNSGAAAFASMAQSAILNSAAGSKDGERTKDEDSHIDSSPPIGFPTPPRTTATSAAHGHPDHDLDQFTRRLAALEERVGNLEAADGKSGRGTGKKSKRR